MEISDRDNALFEAGIKLGALYHQFVGAPVNVHTINSLQHAIRESISAQPYVEDITVHINKEMVAAGSSGKFGYCELQGRMLDIVARIVYGCATAVVGLKFDESMQYPLMRIIDIKET